MWRWLGVALLLGGCAMPAPSIYYCWQVVLTRPDGRQTDALECIPRPHKVPWDEKRGPGKDLFG